MTELERALLRLGDELSFPATPDVSARVLARLAAPSPRRRSHSIPDQPSTGVARPPHNTAC
jgi:hypothetical protein